MTTSTTGWDCDVDILVAGSGAGGLTSAIAAHDCGLSTLVVEKAAAYGGSTGLSGGAIWVPNNPTLKANGLADDPADVRRYLQAIVGNRVPGARLDAYVEHGPAMLDMLHRVSRHMKFRWCPGYSDYHPEAPGGRAAGRTIEPRPIDTRKLGEDERLLIGASYTSPLGVWFTAADVRKLMMFKRTWAGRRMLGVAAWRVASNFFRRRHMKALGGALITRLRLTMKDLGIPLWLNAPIVELVIEDRRVVGAVVERDGVSVRIRARRGVLLATGGFEHDPVLRKEYLPEPGQENYSAGAPSNTGDGHRLGERAGAALDLMDDAWWMPSIALPKGGVFPLVSERCIPPMVIVNAEGKRFTNESSPYVNFVHDQLDGGYVPIYEIFDAKARSRYQFAGILPGQAFPKSYYKCGMVTKADSIAELADRIGVPADNLQATVDRFNQFARNGRDEDFGRGDSAYDRYYGDPTLPNPVLDEIESGPYYAIRLVAGDLGTKGGLVSDEHGQVLRADGTPIAGLYTTGNASASVMGNDYAGAGATIGPAMVFGYLAMRHAVTQPAAVDHAGTGSR